ncbi:photosystem reaction center subunit H [Methylobacterium gregans]|uniref:Photosystem reaction center subunit H n=1 Tax=Methylobacterium gregans TaxID=374424 RepID=A0AA37MCC9_9HYPH|nr:photosystem reaction center subunit H [Methylobacterium gregans]MDQ0524060.1 hypothetical protein [Methylobacterium gregans]GJD81090.1 hypothetical protein NBEOAGPD_4335 [Methylobacterium gregans]GLS56653.1 hypothetical protein GCM10007886_48390 [Methylobacterium gregans]
MIRTRLLIAALALGLSAGAGQAACDVTGARIEEKLAGKSDLQQDANQQTLRDLRTLRDAAIVLDAFKYTAECERLLAIVTELAANPERAIEQGGDTDEDKAESLVQARKPRIPAGGNEPNPKPR